VDFLFDMFFDLYSVLALVLVITIHEFSHAWVANFFGDPTAKIAGRISLNPLKHLDLVGTIMLFLVHIGWGKPVPVNSQYFLHPKRDSALTALAGPFSNLLLAVFLAIPLRYFASGLHPFLLHFLQTLWDFSILLFAFNMLPFPPLDGSKIIAVFVPRRWQSFYERYLQSGSIYFALFLMFDQFVLAPNFGFSFLQYFIGWIVTFLKAVIFFGT